MSRRAGGAGGAAAPDGRAPLGNYAINVSGPADDPGTGEQDEALSARLRRAERWALLGAARKITGLPRLRQGRRVTLTGTGGPAMRHGEGRGAGYSGLSTCGSVWACPCCAARIAARRAEELADVMAAVHAAGGSAHLVTYTMRHHAGQRLATLWDAVSAAWSAVTSGRGWVEDQAGMLGWARVVEVTHSPRSGWHVHVHALFCWAGQVDDEAAQRVAYRGWCRWDRRLRRYGLDSTPVHGVDARPVRFGDGGLGEYFTKAAREVTASYAKDSAGGRSPLAILRDATETYAVDDLKLLWEWERASHGRRQLTWSTAERMDLRRFAGLRAEQSDEEIAMEDTGDEDVITLGADAWDHVSRTGDQSVLLDLAETDGMGAVCAWLDARGLSWQPARPAPRRQGRPPRPPRVTDEARAVLDAPPDG